MKPRLAALGAAVVLMLAGCTGGPPAPGPPPGPPAPCTVSSAGEDCLAEPTSVDVQRTGDVGSQATSSADNGEVQVDSVYDADTLRVLTDGESVPVRVLGIDAPELRPAECWGIESRDAARALLDRQSVVLTMDPEQGDTDHYGRQLRYVELSDGRDLGEVLAAAGHATVYEEYPVAKTPQYRQAQDTARAARLGLWGACWN